MRLSVIWDPFYFLAVINLYFKFSIISEQIVRALEGNLSLSELNEGLFPYEGILPAHMRRSSPFGSTDYDTIQYQEDLKNFKKLALETQELTTTSEFSDLGVLPSTSSSEDLRGTQDIKSGNVKNNTQNQ